MQLVWDVAGAQDGKKRSTRVWRSPWEPPLLDVVAWDGISAELRATLAPPHCAPSPTPSPLRVGASATSPDGRGGGGGAHSSGGAGGAAASLASPVQDVASHHSHGSGSKGSKSGHHKSAALELNAVAEDYSVSAVAKRAAQAEVERIRLAGE